MSSAAIVRSMTGAGIAQGPTEIGDLTIEVRSFNGRGLSVKTRLPSECQGLEAALERRIRDRLTRGTVVVGMDIQNAVRPTGAIVDQGLFGQAAEVLKELAHRHQLGEVHLADVLAVPGVLQSSSAGRSRTSWVPSQAILDLIDRALQQLLERRAAEGEATLRAMRLELDSLEQALAAVEARAPEVIAGHRTRLLTRVNEFLDGRAHQLEDSDVIRELGLFADRVDVTEEVHRLKTHLAETRQQLAAGGEVGRSLEFLMQEMLREVNTIGSKSPDPATSHLVVAMKSAIDRLREQTSNLE